MFSDPDGYVAGIIIGAIIGALVCFGAATYIDNKDDGKHLMKKTKMFNFGNNRTFTLK